MLDVSVPGSHDRVLFDLLSKLGAEFPRLELVRRYRDGDAMLPDEALSGAEREAYKQFARLNRLHVVELVRDACTTRQRVVGFHTAAEDDDDGDVEAWRLWVGSGMKSGARAFFNDFADYARAGLAVEVGFDGRPVIRVVSPWAFAVDADPLRPWESLAAVEIGHDAGSGVDWARLWRRDEGGRVYSRYASRPAEGRSQVPSNGSAWSPPLDYDWDEPAQYFDRLSRVPLNAAVADSGVWEKHIDTIDRINYLTMQGMQVIVTQAFRQAAVAADLPAVYPPDDPFGRAGQPVNYDQVFKLGPAALWRLPPGAELQEFRPVDPRPLREWRDDEIRKLAAFTATPFYMLSSDSANNSAEGAALASEMLLSRVGAMNDSAELVIALALSCAFELAGDARRADFAELETMWAPLKRAALSEIGDAAAKLKAGGATQRWIDERVLGMTPGERAQAQVDRDAESALASLFGGDDAGA